MICKIMLRRSGALTQNHEVCSEQTGQTPFIITMSREIHGMPFIDNIKTLLPSRSHCSMSISSPCDGWASIPIQGVFNMTTHNGT